MKDFQVEDRQNPFLDHMGPNVKIRGYIKSSHLCRWLDILGFNFSLNILKSVRINVCKQTGDNDVTYPRHLIERCATLILRMCTAP